MQVCTSLQTDNHASTPPLSFYRPDALPAANQGSHKVGEKHFPSFLGFSRAINLLFHRLSQQKVNVIMTFIMRVRLVTK